MILQFQKKNTPAKLLLNESKFRQITRAYILKTVKTSAVRMDNIISRFPGLAKKVTDINATDRKDVFKTCMGR